MSMQNVKDNMAYTKLATGWNSFLPGYFTQFPGWVKYIREVLDDING